MRETGRADRLLAFHLLQLFSRTNVKKVGSVMIVDAKARRVRRKDSSSSKSHKAERVVIVFLFLRTIVGIDEEFLKRLAGPYIPHS